MIKRFTCDCSTEVHFHSKSARVQCPDCRKVTEIHPPKGLTDQTPEQGWKVTPSLETLPTIRI